MAGKDIQIEVDDWVRFYDNGQLVIAEVRYVHSAKRGFSDYEVCTDKGMINSKSVIEYRRLAEFIKG